MVCIIDDREDVWNFIPSMVHVKPYNFFEGTADINAPPGMAKGKKSKDGQNGKKMRKSKIVKVLKKKTQRDMASEDKTKADTNENEDKEESSRNRESKVHFASGDSAANTACEVTDSKEEKVSEVGKGDSNEETMLLDETNNSKKDSVEDDFQISDDSSDEEEEDSKSEGSKDDTSKESEGAEEEKEDKKDDKDKAEVKESSGKDDKSKENEVEEEYEEMIEWEDEDDYLYYLEDILKRIHTTFFQMYESNDKKDKQPDLKTIIPYIRKKVLKGVNILFSGVIPTNYTLEKSRAYTVAKALGAKVHTVFVSKEQAKEGEQTTHVVAMRQGTQKVNQAAKHKDVFIVKPDWLWSCNERWDRAEEQLFILPVDMNRINETGRDSPMGKGKKDKSEKDTIAGASTSNISERRFSDTIDLGLQLSADDVKSWQDEVDDEISSSSSDEEEEKKGIDELRSKVLGHTPPESSSDDSLDEGTPKGWKSRKRKRERSVNDEERDAPADEWDADDPDEAKVKLCIEARESPHRVFHRGSESSSSSDNESIGSIDDEMVEAIEREFF